MMSYPGKSVSHKNVHKYCDMCEGTVCPDCFNTFTDTESEAKDLIAVSGTLSGYFYKEPEYIRQVLSFLRPNYAKTLGKLDADECPTNHYMCLNCVHALEKIYIDALPLEKIPLHINENWITEGAFERIKERLSHGV